jgi:hypothetical protein
MSYSKIRLLLPSACLLGWALAGCGSDGVRPFGAGGSGGHQSETTGGTSGDDGGAAGEPGTGGKPEGSGGSLGTGGSSSSGGAVGTGGDVAASGGRGAGARPGSGGAGNLGGKGTGGVLGSGGHPGTGGMTASGGSLGSGGGGGSGPDPSKCDQLASDYQKEMPNAKMCTIGSSVPQCQTPIAGSLGCLSSCKTYVQTATTLMEIASKWTNEGCGSINRVCPAIACIAPQPGTCVASTTGTPPQCQNGPTPVLLQN